MGIPSGNQTWLAGKSSVCIENGKGFNGKIGYKWWIFHLLSTKMECYFFLFDLFFSPFCFFSWISVSLLLCLCAFLLPASLLVCFSKTPAFLLLCLSLLLCFSAFPAFLLLCFSASLLFCFSAFLLLCFPCFFVS